MEDIEDIIEDMALVDIEDETLIGLGEDGKD